MCILVDGAGEHVLYPPESVLKYGCCVFYFYYDDGGQRCAEGGGTAKIVGTWACAMVPMDDLAVLVRRKWAHSWKSCHLYRLSGNDLETLPATCFDVLSEPLIETSHVQFVPFYV
jgi:hypothetical protein